MRAHGGPPRAPGAGSHRGAPRRRVPRTVVILSAVGAAVLLVVPAAQAFLGGGEQPTTGSSRVVTPMATVHGTLQTQEFWVDQHLPGGTRPPSCPVVRVRVADADDTVHALTTARLERRTARPDPRDHAVRRLTCRLSYRLRLPRADGYVVTLPGLDAGGNAVVIPDWLAVRRTGDVVDAGETFVMLGSS